MLRCANVESGRHPTVLSVRCKTGSARTPRIVSVGMNITTRQLKAFVLTARHQSFSRAAEELFITQSGMSVLVRELEDQLGFRLFERTTRRVTLTEFGTRFLPIAARSLLALESAAGNIGRSASAADRRLSIGGPPLMAGKLLAG